MPLTNDYDENLWFEHLGCEGKHYIIGNPHTYTGRMWAWCPVNNRSIFVSKNDMGEMSDMTMYWVDGYLHGCQPPPPIDESGDVNFDSLAYKFWEKEVALFTKSGYWYHGGARKCVNCQEFLLSSEPNEVCAVCKNNVGN